MLPKPVVFYLLCENLHECISQYKNSSFFEPKKIYGRPRKFTNRDVRKVIRKCLENALISIDFLSGCTVVEKSLGPPREKNFFPSF